MNKLKIFFRLLFILCFVVFIVSCNNVNKPSGKDRTHSAKELQQKTISHLESFIRYSAEHKGKIDDSTSLSFPKALELNYKKDLNRPFWSNGGQWLPLGDSLFKLISNSKLYGLFPEDYHFNQLSFIHTLFYNDSTSVSDRTDATLWAKADLLLTDAFFKIVKDIKLGRLPQDSITMRKDSVLTDAFFSRQLDSVKQSGKLLSTIHELEPDIKAYYLLKQGIKKFLADYDNKTYTFVPSPSSDRANYKQLLQKRLFEGGFIATDSIPADSVHLSNALKKFQEKKGLEADGKIGSQTLRELNTTDKERFVRIAITMDRFKMLPKEMPKQYIWVNLPAYSLQVWDSNTIKFTSRIVCGKPATRSPVLTSAIAELITYPKWTIPSSIVEKEVLPGVKKNPNYFRKKGYGVYDSKGNEINPDSVDWQKFNRTIPYHVIQGSGDANALGVLKFNFNNKYAVYLHDTNERYLFGRNDRAMSHGCIRVQAWQQLADYVLVRDDGDGKAFLRIDSMQRWLKKKEKHSIWVKNKLPLFIRYYTCEGKDGNIVFYSDIYGEDKKLAEKYFAGK